MIIQDEGVILGIRCFSDNQWLLTVFCKEHGLFKGLIKKSSFNPGNIVYVEWNARLVEHLGRMKCEIIEDVTSRIYCSKDKLIMLSNALLTLAKVIPEKFPKQMLYDSLVLFIKSLREDDWYGVYINFEIVLLHEIGFGIDMSKCVITNVSDIAFISPKTAKCVSHEIGYIYKNKLFLIPKMLTMVYNKKIYGFYEDKKGFIESLKILDYFLHKFFLLPMGIKNIEFRAETIRFFEEKNANML